MAKRRTKFEEFAEKCEYRTEDIDYEPPMGSGEPGDSPYGNLYFDCTHPKRSTEREPPCDRDWCPLEGRGSG